MKEVFTYTREALSLFPISHPERSVSLNNLANAVLARYELLDSTDDLEEAVTLFTYYREALKENASGFT
jgi:hypothetical protein